MAKYKTIFAFNEDDAKKRNIAIKNINNLIKDLGPENIQIELVAYADAVTNLYLKNSEYQKQLEDLHNKGVILAVCANTLIDKNISNEQLLPFIQIISSAVGELTRKQAEGWSYIKI
ncbi:DsrE family protein [Desulfolucanica intricata]|uniref:DsrE family protein n=1 Tax=Desulfolucanica intricata TaxID=1285191 RepID=UPI00082A7EDE|nr:DsrE family protein [Desulfolucanica intricata]